MSLQKLILPSLLTFTVGLFGLTSVLTAQPAAPPAGSAEVTPDILKRQQEQNAKLYKDLEQAMLRLAQRLEKSDRPEDKSRAQTIRKALDRSTNSNVTKMFEDMVAGFAKTGNPTSGSVDEWLRGDEQLRAALVEILAILMTDDDTARLKAEIERLKAFLKEAERIKRAQEIIQARTDANREKNDRIAKDQRDLAEQTADLARRMAGEKKGEQSKTGTQSPNAGEPKDTQSESKPEGKPGDQNAQNKKDTGEEKSSNKDPQGGKDPMGKQGSKEGSGFNDLDTGLVRETKTKLADDLSKSLASGHPGLIRVVKIENPQKDFFDIAVVLKDLVVPATEIQPQYRIDLNVQATDTNVENPEGPKIGKNIEPIRLKVISEADLLVEISKEEEGLIVRVDEALRRLLEAQRKISEMSGTYATVPNDEIVNLAVRGIDIGQDVAKGREVTAGVLVDYRRILTECEVNRMQKATIDRFRNVVVNPLNAILEDNLRGSFRNAEMAMAALQTPLNESRRPDFATMEAANSSVRQLVERMQELRNQLGESLSIAKLRDRIQAILKNQQDLKNMLDNLSKDIRERLFRPDIRPAGPVALAKGESKKIKHAIDWKLYDKDDLVITFMASDPSLKVPTEVKVLADQLDFEYEITAGQAVGEFTVTVVPAVGKPVVVRVTVK